MLSWIYCRGFRATGGGGVQFGVLSLSSEGASLSVIGEARKVCINCTGSVVGHNSEIRCACLISYL